MTKEELLDAIRVWHGALAQWWMFNVSHGEFVLHICRPKDKRSTFLKCAGCSYICGPTAWEPLNLEVSEVKGDCGIEYTIRDIAARFEVRCLIVALTSNDPYVQKTQAI